MSAKPSIAMTPEELRSFLAAMPYVVICVPDAQGNLVARAVRHRLQGDAAGGELTTLTGLSLDLSGAARDLPAGLGACAITDTNLEYFGIKGAILRGALEAAPGGQARLKIEHASGFDFAKIPPYRK
jgi:hypothetical protein